MTNIPTPDEVRENKKKSIEDSVVDDGIDGFNLTDTGNAELIASLYGDKIRYDHKRGRWLVWGEHRWIPDADESVKRIAIKCARKRYQQAVEIPDTREREKVSRWAIQSEGEHKVNATLSMLRALKPIADKGDDWDKKNFLLACKNGVINLKTGKLRDGKPEDRITMSATIEYIPNAKCPRWELFIREIFADNEELIKYVHKALGYTLTGSTCEQVAFFCYGGGRNGKTVLFKTIKNILGDYAYNASAKLFQGRYSQGAEPEVVATESRRFLVSSETLVTSKINEQRLKTWTGGDSVTARALYKEEQTFEPTVKPWLFLNHRPKTEDDSYAFWRRIRSIPFIVKFEGEKEDKNLSEKLELESKGILTWLVRGCLLWNKESLEDIPQVVRSATADYQSENDELFDYLAANYTEKEDVKALDAFTKYTKWAEESGVKTKDIMSKTMFGRRMSDRFEKVRKTDGIYYLNVQNPTYSRHNMYSLPPKNNKPLRESAIGGLCKTTSNPTTLHKKKVYENTPKGDYLSAKPTQQPLSVTMEEINKDLGHE